jgi:hypothetical protein
LREEGVRDGSVRRRFQHGRTGEEYLLSLEMQSRSWNTDIERVKVEFLEKALEHNIRGMLLAIDKDTADQQYKIFQNGYERLPEHYKRNTRAVTSRISLSEYDNSEIVFPLVAIRAILDNKKDGLDNPKMFYENLSAIDGILRELYEKDTSQGHLRKSAYLRGGIALVNRYLPKPIEYRGGSYIIPEYSN